MGCFTKLALFIINFAIFAFGVAIVALASIIIHKDDTYRALLGDGVFTLPIIVLIGGLIIVIIGFLGCCGAMKESKCMLNTYAFIVIVLLLAELTCGILLLIYPNQAEEFLKETMGEAYKSYGEDPTATKSIDIIQSDLHCCGVENYTDWQSWPYGQTGNVSRGCCKEDDGSGTCFMNKNTLPENEAAKSIYTKGCYQAMKDDLKEEVVALCVVLFIMVVIQVLAVTCACGIAKRSSSHHYA